MPATCLSIPTDSIVSLTSNLLSSTPFKCHNTTKAFMGVGQE
jgi:hypothetical protein